MPIIIQDNISLVDVEREIEAFEVQYEMTSAEFSDPMRSGRSVPEFDALEWEFLLMQKATFEGSGECSSARVFSAKCETQTDSVPVDQVQDLIAA